MSIRKTRADSLDLIMPQGADGAPAAAPQKGNAPTGRKTSFVLSEDLIEPLAVAAARSRLRKSDLICEALRIYLRDNGYMG